MSEVRTLNELRTRPRRREGSRRQAPPPGPLQTAFVLSGGASLGALQVAMLQALYERGVTPDFLIATSGGGLSAALVEAAASIPASFRPLGSPSTGRSTAVWSTARRFPTRPSSEPSGSTFSRLRIRAAFPRRPPQSALDEAMYALCALVDGRLDADVAQYSQEVELVLLLAPNPAGIQPTSFDRSGRLIGQALEAARACLASQNAGRHPRLLTTEVG